MPNQDIFCNSPWYELQIYWDGGLGFCCQEAHRIYPPEQGSQYNIATMSIAEWFDSEPMRQARLAMFRSSRNSMCRRCYSEEDLGASSRRIRSNQKSVIFRSAFNDSYVQSPGNDKFESSRLNAGRYSGLPIDLHIDLGNYCNLACKMCRPEASSTIATQLVKWGIKSAKQYVGTDWTRNQAVWDRTIAEIAAIPNLKNIHFMGGETLITPRFEEFVDAMLVQGRTDLCFSFVTNGTVFNPALIEKLKHFARVGIEVSIESITDHNAYQRQGTDTQVVLDNLAQYQQHTNGSNITLTIRPAISALTIGSYWTLLEYCLANKLLVKSLIVETPAFLDPRVLPLFVRAAYKQAYLDLAQRHDLDQIDHIADYNESDPNQYLRIIKQQIDQCLALLNAEAKSGIEQLVAHCKKWDSTYKLNAVELYPELAEIFVTNGY